MFRLEAKTTAFLSAITMGKTLHMLQLPFELWPNRIVWCKKSYIYKNKTHFVQGRCSAHKNIIKKLSGMYLTCL